MKVYPFAIQRYPHYIMTCNPVLYGWIFLYIDFTHRTTGIYSKSASKQRTNSTGVTGLSEFGTRLLYPRKPETAFKIIWG